ncbi:MAG: pyridoxamine 5'-phosphate oxidase family protein, partial [Actinomycetota bacterium]
RARPPAGRWRLGRIGPGTPPLMPTFPVSGSAPGPPTARTQVRRHPERGAYDRASIDAILDEALICHVAWVMPDGGPRVIPTIHVRVGDVVYIHGSEASRTLRGLRTGVKCCLETTLVDAIVLARSTPRTRSTTARSSSTGSRAR